MQSRLDQHALTLLAYTAGAFANNPDGCSQMVYIVLLADASDTCNILTYRSFKSRRVTRSVNGMEVMAFAEAFDTAYFLAKDLQIVICKGIPLTF